MRIYSKWAAIAASASLGLFLTPAAVVSAADPVPAANQSASEKTHAALAWPAGFQDKHVQPDAGIKTGLVKLTERSVTKGDFHSMLAELSRPDRERAREFKGADQAKLDGLITKIQTEWKAKYGKDFDINDKNVVFDNHFQILEGEVSDPATAMANWPVTCCMNGEAVTASGKQPAGDTKEVKKEARAAKLDKGRNVALVRFPAMDNKADLTVSMVHHIPGFWRIDIPDDRTGEQIYNDLVTHLTWVGDHADHWPSDVNDAYRMISRHAIMAVYGVPMAEHLKG